jgi:hypothetical protein
MLHRYLFPLFGGGEHKTGNEKQLKALSKQTKRVARAGGSAEIVEG